MIEMNLNEIRTRRTNSFNKKIVEFYYDSANKCCKGTRSRRSASSKKTIECHYCTKIIEGQVINIGGCLYCRVCSERLFVVCDGCQALEHHSNILMVGDYDYCISCMCICEHCDCHILLEDIMLVEDEEANKTIGVCVDCYENVSFTLIRKKTLEIRNMEKALKTKKEHKS